MNTIKTYLGPITSLNDDEIFVFGSNTQGRHGRGAALFARQKCGAIYGQSSGLQGKSYAIITKDLTKKIHPSITMGEILLQIIQLYDYAKKNPNTKFLIAYSGNGSNLNGYSNEAMAQMFYDAGQIPNNIVFEDSFYNLIIAKT